MKRFLVIVLSAASLAVGAEGRAGMGMIAWGTTIHSRFFFVDGPCTPVHSGEWGCVDLSPKGILFLIDDPYPNGNAVRVRVGGQVVEVANDGLQTNFNQILQQHGNDLAKARVPLEKALFTTSSNGGGGMTSLVRVQTAVKNITGIFYNIAPQNVPGLAYNTETGVVLRVEGARKAGEKIRTGLASGEKGITELVGDLLLQKNGQGFRDLFVKYGADGNLDFVFGPGTLRAKQITFTVTADARQVRVTIK